MEVEQHDFAAEYITYTSGVMKCPKRKNIYSKMRQNKSLKKELDKLCRKPLPIRVH